MTIQTDIFPASRMLNGDNNLFPLTRHDQQVVPDTVSDSRQKTNPLNFYPRPPNYWKTHPYLAMTLRVERNLYTILHRLLECNRSLNEFKGSITLQEDASVGESLSITNIDTLTRNVVIRYHPELLNLHPSVIAFVIAHEVGHIIYDYLPYETSMELQKRGSMDGYAYEPIADLMGIALTQKSGYPFDPARFAETLKFEGRRNHLFHDVVKALQCKNEATRLDALERHVPGISSFSTNSFLYKILNPLLTEGLKKP